MKKNKIIIIFIMLFLLFIEPVYAKEEKALYKECVDGDTIKVTIKDEEKTVRFLAIDTPETKHPKKKAEPYGQEASNYTCEAIKNSKEIILEYDNNSDETDKYGRILAWVWVDGNLLQKELIKSGLAKVAYLYDDYKYTSELQGLEKVAQEKKIGIWSNSKNDQIEPIYTYIAIALIIVIIIVILVPKYRKKAINKVKRETKKELKKYMSKVVKWN